MNFCYWLQGYFEINGAGLEGANVSIGIPHNQAVVIKRHLDMVFAHDIDPKAGDADHQAKLNKIHKPITAPKFPSDGDQVYRC